MTWLALFALGLLVTAPVISRVLMSGDMVATTAAWCGSHPPGHAGDGHGSPLDKCGYCGYLHHNPLVPGLAVAVVPAAVHPGGMAAQRVPTPADLVPHLAAHPRGPPLKTSVLPA